MGKRLDALLGKGFKISKFKATVTVAISRLAVLKNQRQARCSIARSDVAEFLSSSNHERALLRVEQVIKEQNMLDVFVVLESYCHLLIERINLIEQEKVCPEELNEGVSTLIFAASRCGEFPELQEIRAIFTARFGKEFAARAVELRNNCGVNHMVIQKLSTRMPSLENKMKVLKEIAAENNIDLPIEEDVSATTVENQAPSGVSRPGDNKLKQPEERGGDFSNSGQMRREYRDVADAAQAAFESAAYAAAAARAAVELSRSQSMDPDDPSSPNIRPRKLSATKSGLQTRDKESLEDEGMKTELKFEKIHPAQKNVLETKDGSLRVEKGMEQLKQNENGTGFKRSVSDLSSYSQDDNMKENRISSDEEGQIKKRDVVFDESDSEDEQKSGMPGTYDLDADRKNDIVEGSSKAHKNFPLRSQVGLKMESGLGNSPAYFAAEKRTQTIEPLNINRRPISVRNRRTQGW